MLRLHNAYLHTQTQMYCSFKVDKLLLVDTVKLGEEALGVRNIIFLV